MHLPKTNDLSPHPAAMARRNGIGQYPATRSSTLSRRELRRIVAEMLG